MKIAWFTPFSRKSAIGRCSQLVVRELHRQADVDLYTSDGDDLRWTPARLIRFTRASSLPPEKIASYDLIAYSLGNHLRYHGEIFAAAQRWPGVVILHDFVMQHFFASLYLERLRLPDAYKLLMESCYGDRGRHAAQRSLEQPPLWDTDAVMEFPLFEPALKNATGAIAHSRFFADRIRTVFQGPVAEIPLPFEIEAEESSDARSALGLSNHAPLIVTAGHINPNKRPEAVVEALAVLQRPDLIYALVGPIEDSYRRQLEQIAAGAGLQSQLLFTGYVSDRQMGSWLRAADLCVNLRWPSIEGASGSLVEQMLYRKPVIVCRAGSFLDLPDQVVSKVDSACNPPEIARAIEALLRDPEAARSVGTRAAEYARSRHQPAHYARQFVSFAQRIRKAAPVRRVADRVATECNRLGLCASDPLIGRAAGEIHTLFVADNSGPYPEQSQL
jgi:glycosyltransferase involved in cell wall biosynthesis